MLVYGGNMDTVESLNSHGYMQTFIHVYQVTVSKQDVFVVPFDVWHTAYGISQDIQILQPLGVSGQRLGVKNTSFYQSPPRAN